MEKTLKTLDEIMGRIKTHPEYSMHVNRDYIDFLKGEADRHSCYLENKTEQCKNCSGKCYDNLKDARDFLGREGINIHSLSKLGHIVEPYDYEGKKTPEGFRQTELQFGGFAPSSPSIIHQQIDDLTYFLNEGSDEFHPVIRSVKAHLELVKIHPYIDGNGRGARVLQDFCLQQKNYPSAIIFDSEKEYYIGVLHEALNDKYNNKNSLHTSTIAEKLFQTFIASKVLRSAEKLEKQLREKRVYHVNFLKKLDKSLVNSVSQNLRGIGKKNGKIISIERKKFQKYFSLEITGDIGKEELNAWLGKTAERNKFKYNLESITF